MNLIKGNVDDRGIFTSAGCKIDLSPVLGKRCGQFVGKPLTVGIRPEDLQPTASEGASIEGQIEIVEDLGSDKFVHLTCGNRQLISRLPPNVFVNQGDPLQLTADPKKLHFFHQGHRI